MAPAQKFRSVDEMFRSCTEANPDTVILGYPSTGNEFVDYTCGQLEIMVQRAARRYSKALPKIRKTSDDPHITVAVLGVTNLEYIITYLALQRLGLTCLFLSTRLQENAFLHLFDATHCEVVLAQQSFQAIMERAKALKEDPLDILPMVDFEYIQSAHSDDREPLVAEIDPEKETTQSGWIIHSSGSTGLPKPIWQTNHGSIRAAESMTIPYDSLVTLPLFHTFGLYTLLHGIRDGRKTSFYNADLPLTGPNVVAALESSKADVMFTVPYALKLTVEAEGGVEALKKLKEIVYGGASCPQELGDMLTSQGVKLSNYFGSTEAGFILKYCDEGWNWLSPISIAAPFIKWEHEGGDLYQLVILPGWPSLVMTNREDGSYATKDLFQRHPANPNAWRYMDRLDSTIVLNNGEKANPILLENNVRKNRYVTESIVFGAGKPTLGMVIIQSEHAEGMSREEFLKVMSEDLEHGNSMVPAYAKVFPDAIILKPAGTAFPRTDKGTAIRAAFIREFQPDIDAYYTQLESQEANSGKDMSEAEIRQFVRATVANALQIPEGDVKDDTDFFSLGLDSLMAIGVRRKLAQEVNTNGKVLGANVVFEKPNIDALTRFLVSLGNGIQEKERSAEEKMEELVNKYSTFTRHVSGDVQVDGEYVVLTGATGSLGAFILATLLQRPTVQKVYCFVRARSANAGQARVISALEKAHRLQQLTDAQKAKIVALPTDLSQATFGLKQEMYDQILREVTVVIHNAWSVNFNMDVTSFEEQHIRGTWNLINFCLSSPHRTPASFNFISSVSTAMNMGTRTIPEVLPKFGDAMPMGYAHSKLVAERICTVAAAKSDIAARILRVGQIVGDTEHGMWNATEAPPLTVQSATTIGALPVISKDDEELSWIPVDVTAATIVDLSLLDRLQDAHVPARNAVLHVCHPKVLYWNRDVLPALQKAGLKFEAVDQHEWVRRLEASEQDPAKNPPIKLLDFFKKRYADETVSEPYFETVESCKYSPSLREAKEVDAELVGRFLRYWQEKCW
ncbi:hypothetical protein FN846DRAFT_893478 [Sphaerosporella brunnea]|uniref:Carrier domain-containing protein n=1 Tax=Sphaerosporella brunnea TaxID=1250544 RepID=A0A5J5EKM3_9PEZI|nr:hypothetical protein FN846DRAFT_893478 [Sphaerosporella brunnea]